MQGRKPKPVEQKKAEGNPGHRPLPEPLMVAGRPGLEEMATPPAHLPEDAKEFWRDSIVRLVEVGIIDRVDGPALEQLAVQYARIRGAQRVIAESGYFSKGSTGQIREHPALRIEREATNQFLKIAEHFALTPIARTRLGLAELHRRSLSSEMASGLGKPNLRPASDGRPRVTIEV
jgi:P27 family predicted phage terminase small subunit